MKLYIYLYDLQYFKRGCANFHSVNYLCVCVGGGGGDTFHSKLYDIFCIKVKLKFCTLRLSYGFICNYLLFIKSRGG